MLDTFRYGVCYYPEAWSPDRLASDVRRIRDCGFDVVRMGEGAWGYWEPREGEYQFDLFDRAIDLCRRNGIKVVLGTPTYCGPAWISSNYPEVLRWNFDRVPMRHGSRRHFNYTSPKYLDLSDKVCAALAEHYKDDPQVIGWQLDNEFNCHMDVSYAPSDTLAFRIWLREKYGTLDALNAAWGTRFWSQQYDAWEQVDLPHPTVTWMNPTQLLDESRFVSDCVVKFARRQAAVLRARNPGWKITHNGLFANVDGPALARELDFFSHDNYPLFSSEWPGPVWGLAAARSLSFPFAVMEQQSGPGGQMGYLHATPRLGQLGLWAWQAVAHGAKSLLYFRWRTCPYGAEQHWHGLLDPDDRDNRRTAEATLAGGQLRKLPAAFHDTPPARAVAVLREYDNETNDRRINTYAKAGQGEAYRWVAACARRHLPVDVAWPASDFAGYALLVAPHLKIVDAALVEKLTAFVEAGGTLLLAAQAGSKDRNCHLVESPLPGLLRGLAGVSVDDWTMLPETQTREARTADGRTLALDTFVERLATTGAEPLARWTDADALLADAPAVTRHAVGRGAVVYVAGYCPAAAVDTLLDVLTPLAGLKPTADAGPDVEIIDRADTSRRFVVLLNHSTSPQRVTGLPTGTELLTGNPVAGEWTLDGFAVAVVQADRK